LTELARRAYLGGGVSLLGVEEEVGIAIVLGYQPVGERPDCNAETCSTAATWVISGGFLGDVVNSADA